MDTKSQPEEISRFTALVQNLNRGLVEKELDNLIEEALQSIHDWGGVAKINLTVNIAKNKEHDDVILIKESITHKFPEEPRKTSLMFTNSKNKLIMQRQDQESLDFNQSSNQTVTPTLTPSSHITPITGIN